MHCIYIFRSFPITNQFKLNWLKLDLTLNVQNSYSVYWTNRNLHLLNGTSTFPFGFSLFRGCHSKSLFFRMEQILKVLIEKIGNFLVFRQWWSKARWPRINCPNSSTTAAVFGWNDPLEKTPPLPRREEEGGTDRRRESQGKGSAADRRRWRWPARIMANFEGNWKMKSSLNFEELLKALGEFCNLVIKCCK